MLTDFILYFVGILLLGLVHALVNNYITKESPTSLYNVTTFLVLVLFALCSSIFFIAIEYFSVFSDLNIFIIGVVSSAFIMSYWFYIAPIFSLLKTKAQYRDLLLEEELSKNKYNFKVLLSEKIVTNAFATGGLPYLKLIIIAKNLKEILSHDELMAVVYHEVGHHKKNHIFKLFCIQVVINSFYFVAFDYFLNLKLQQSYELIGVGLLGAFAGLAFYYIPNKFLYYCEFSADSFSAAIIGENILSNALSKVNIHCQGKLEKGNVNHPPLTLRLENIRNG